MWGFLFTWKTYRTTYENAVLSGICPPPLADKDWYGRASFAIYKPLKSAYSAAMQLLFHHQDMSRIWWRAKNLWGLECLQVIFLDDSGLTFGAGEWQPRHRQIRAGVIVWDDTPYNWLLTFIRIKRMGFQGPAVVPCILPFDVFQQKTGHINRVSISEAFVTTGVKSIWLYFLFNFMQSSFCSSVQ